MSFPRRTPGRNPCGAGSRDYNEYLGADRDERGYTNCPLCGKIVLLRKNHRGWRSIIPTHMPPYAEAA